MRSSVKNSLGSVALVTGCCIYLSSNLVGHGWELPPNPLQGFLVAACGMMLCGLATALTPDAESRRDVCGILKAVLLLGAFTLLVTLAGGAFRPFFDLNNARWGAVPPPGMIFGAFYGVVSLAGIISLEAWEHEHLSGCHGQRLAVLSRDGVAEGWRRKTAGLMDEWIRIPVRAAAPPESPRRPSAAR